MHEAALQFIRREAARLPAGVRVYEIGSRNVNGSARVAFPHASVYYGIDLAPGLDVDAVADGLDHMPPFVPDVVVCCEVLEHAPHAESLCHRAFEVLSEGGIFIATTAGPMREPHSAVDGGPLRPGEFYQNCDPDIIAAWCLPFSAIYITPTDDLLDVYFVCARYRLM